MNVKTDSLLRLVDRFDGLRVAVWGDLILDEYLYGHTRRISREAPVLILSYGRREYVLGGAGNALQNIKALGAEPLPVGVVGRDEAGDRVLNLLADAGISTRRVLRDPKYATPQKTRIMAGDENTRQQQILRIDRESRAPETGTLRDRLEATLGGCLPSCRALLVSDYNYATVRPDLFRSLLPRLRRSRLPVALDSRFRLLQFPGATIATPNESEAENALAAEFHGDGDVLTAAGRRLLARLRSPALLITRGSRGMALFERRRPPLLISAHGPTDIVDVTGAGDTVISVFTLALAAGATFPEAAVLSNRAAGVVVMKKGAATLSPDELRQAILS